MSKGCWLSFKPGSLYLSLWGLLSIVVFGFWPGLHSYISPVSIDTVTDTVEYLGHDTGVSVITLGIPPFPVVFNPLPWPGQV